MITRATNATRHADVSRRSFVKTVGVGTAGAALLSFDGPRAWARTISLDLPQDERPLYLHNNENPLGAGARVVAAMNESLRGGPEAGRYPGGSGALMESLARMHSVPLDHVMIGNGSTQLLRSATQVFTSPTRPLVTGAPSYEEPSGYASLIGHAVRSVPLDRNLRLDLGAMADAARGAGLVFVNNPNNPTATVHGRDAMGAFIERVLRETDAMILIDEAYHDYVTDPAYTTEIPRAVREDRIIVTRTFSKAHGMAGMRIGWCVTQPNTIAKMRRWHYGLSLNVPSLYGAKTSIEHPDRIAEERDRNTAARQFTVDWFTSRGLEVTDGQCNFIFAKTGLTATDFRTANAAHNVLVGRDFPPYESEWSRISISTMEDMRRAVEVFDQVLAATDQQPQSRRAEAAA